MYALRAVRRVAGIERHWILAGLDDGVGVGRSEYSVWDTSIHANNHVGKASSQIATNPIDRSEVIAESAVRPTS